MTIQTYNPVSCNCSETHFWTNVKECSDDMIVFNNGEKYFKRLCAKVKLLSLRDFEGKSLEDWQAFEREVGAETAQYIPMTKAEFSSLDLLTHI